MIIYILIFLIIVSAIFYVKENKQYSRFLQLWIITFFAIVVGIRNGVGTDFKAYQNIFNTPFDQIYYYNQNPLFILFCFFFKKLGLGFPTFSFFFSFLTSFIIYKVINRALPKYALYCLLIYYVFFFHRFQFNQIRHGIMVSFIWLAFSYIHSGQLRKYLLCVLVAGLFHSVGFIFIPFYWVLKQIFSIKTVLITLICAFFLGSFINIGEALSFLPSESSLAAKVSYYTIDYYAGESSSQQLTIGFFFNLLILLIILKKRKKIEEIQMSNTLINCLFCGLTIFLFCRSYGIFVERISSCFYVSLIFLIPIFFLYLPNKKSLKYICLFALFLYAILILHKNITAVESSGSFQYLPYKTIFMN